MLLSEIPNKRPYRNFKTLIVLILASLIVSACGFRPLYGKHGAGTFPAEQYLARIDIAQINDRIGQQLRNNLLSRLSPKGVADKPLYSLNITIAESIANLGVKKSAVVTRGNLRLSASYSLTLIKRDKENQQMHLADGSVLSVSSYDIPQAQYAARAALKDARTRATKELADDIRTRLAVYFKQNPDKL